jgi:hypothetical protein
MKTKKKPVVKKRALKRPPRPRPPVEAEAPPVIVNPMERIGKVHLVQLKLTATEYELLDRFAAKHGYESRSGYIRAGLGKMFELHCMTADEESKIEQERGWHRPRRSSRSKFQKRAWYH